MKSFTKPSFWKLYTALSKEAQAQARKCYQLFGQNPEHPGLNFKKLSGPGEFWSVRGKINTVPSVNGPAPR